MSRNRELRGWHVGVVLVTFFATVLAVNLAMALLASRSWSGLIAKNGYVASQDFDRQRAARERALALGWRLDIQDRDGWVVVRVVGAPTDFRAPDLAVRAERPFTDAEDATLAMAHTGGGAWRAHRPLPPGRWTVVATIEDGAARLAQRRRIVVEAPR